MHNLLVLKNISLCFPHKECFSDFSATITRDSRIAIIGRNGSGKSSLLNLISGVILPSSGKVVTAEGIKISHIPQVIKSPKELSGGERFLKMLGEALSEEPDILLLDEPTNHLDQENRKSLYKKLKSFRGAIIAASHDVALLRTLCPVLWHIDNGKINVFGGGYDDYTHTLADKRDSVLREFKTLKKERTFTHQALMKEQKRASSSRLAGKKMAAQRRWTPSVTNSKASRAEQISGRKKKELRSAKEDIRNRLNSLNLPQIIKPKFSITPIDIMKKTIVSVTEGGVSYGGEYVLKNISLTVTGNEKIAISGNNGSGKTTLVRAIIGSEALNKTGKWYSVPASDIGYLDQHYSNLPARTNAFEIMRNAEKELSDAQIRRFLSDFLFYSDEEVYNPVEYLSGGEKARLSLALIALKTPKLLILDELTNNIDLDTRRHIIEVLSVYPGAVIAISHDADFLNEIGVESFYTIRNASLSPL